VSDHELQKEIAYHRAMIHAAELSRLNNEPVYTQKEIDDKIEKVLRVSENLEE